MNFYPIIILSKNKNIKLNTNYLQISESIKLINQTSLIHNNCEISFDYLIFDDTNLISNFFETNILHDNKIPVTNFFKVTSIENILYTNDINQSILDIENNEF